MEDILKTPLKMPRNKCVYSFYSTWSMNQWDLREGTVANQVGQLQGFIAVGDHPNF